MSPSQARRGCSWLNTLHVNPTKRIKLCIEFLIPSKLWTPQEERWSTGILCMGYNMLQHQLNSELFFSYSSSFHQALEFAPVDVIYAISLRLTGLSLIIHLMDTSHLLALSHLCCHYQLPKIHRFLFLFLHRRRGKKRAQTWEKIMSLWNCQTGLN